MNFPIQLIDSNMSILCLFASGFGGENDVLHLHRARCLDVTIADRDATTLHQLADKTGYTPLLMDIVNGYDVISRDCYDVIISDQFTNLHKWANTVLVNHFSKGRAKLLIIGAGIKERQKYNKDYYIERSDYMGGQYWRVINLKR